MLELLQSQGFCPRVATWELTQACNMRCLHCDSRATENRSEELTPKQALRVCEELAEAECQCVTLTGGEPLLRQDWPDIARALVNAGIRVTMITNGQRFTEATADVALDVGIRQFLFSVDGLEDSHTYIRGVKGNWQKNFSNFEICRRKGISIGVVTTIFRTNVNELEQMRELFIDAGVEVWQLQLAIPLVNPDSSRDLFIDSEDVLTLIPLLADMRQRPGLRIVVGDNIGYFGGYEDDLRSPSGSDDDEEGRGFWAGCNAGCSVVGIESNGNIKGCLSLPSARNGVDRFVEGNLRKRSFRDIWEDANAFAHNRQFDVEHLEGFCRTCEYSEVCRGGCTAAALAHSGHQNASRYCYHRLLQERDSTDSE